MADYQEKNGMEIDVFETRFTTPAGEPIQPSARRSSSARAKPEEISVKESGNGNGRMHVLEPR